MPQLIEKNCLIKFQKFQNPNLDSFQYARIRQDCSQITLSVLTVLSIPLPYFHEIVLFLVITSQSI